MTSAEEVEYNLNKLSFPLRATAILIGVFFINVRKSYTPNLFIFFELIKYISLYAFRCNSCNCLS